MAIVLVAAEDGDPGPLLVFKALGAVAVLTSAEAGRRLARRLSPGREELVFVALALNRSSSSRASRTRTTTSS